MQGSLVILGGGTLGRAVAHILQKGGLSPRIWSRSEKTRAKARKSLGAEAVVDTLEEAAAEAAAVLLAIPAPALREVCRAFGEVARGDQIVIHACRGVTEEFKLPHQVIREETCVRKVGVLGGPLHATELASGRPLAVVLASRFDETIETVTRLTAATPVRIHPSHDVIGVEVAGAISNVTALAVGMADGLDLGETPRGVLMMRGLAEAGVLGRALGAARETFAGLAGVGDLIPRRVATTDRHRELGARLGKGDSLEKVLKGAEALEGVVTAREAGPVMAHLGISLPLVGAVAKVLSGETPPAEALESVLRLDLDLERPLAEAR
jgi:glycerol-3-phosphate dehydrogenase (NAD(P)+)